MSTPLRRGGVIPRAPNGTDRYGEMPADPRIGLVGRELQIYLVAMAKRTEGIARDNLIVLGEIRDVLVEISKKIPEAPAKAGTGN